MSLLAVIGQREIRMLNEDNTDIRVDRAARSATALFQQVHSDYVVECDKTGSPERVRIDDGRRLEPGDDFDTLVDTISSVNQGAANLFRFDPVTMSFGRLATSFKDDDGNRVGSSQFEPGLIVEGHPAFESLLRTEPYIGEVPVAGRMRYAYLTPIVDIDFELVGLLAVDVGWVDDLNRINTDVAGRVVWVVLVLLAIMAVAGIVVMYFTFRPMNRLIKVAHELGADDGPDTVVLTNRRDEIGYLAKGLSKVADLQRSLEYRAYHDSLTGTPNRAAFVRELERRFDELDVDRNPDEHGFALLIVDLDGFKEVNDGLGHQAGDELLKSLTCSLRHALLPGEFLARFGGDEFALLTAPGSTDAAFIEATSARVSASVAGVRQTSAGETSITASIGIALVPEHGSTAEMALSHADLAMYAVKRDGRGRAMVYQSGLSSPVHRRLHVANELRRAMEEHVIRLDYQPLIDARTGRVHSVEALARWTHETEGRIGPDEFIRVAENAGLINDLGKYVIEQACAQIAAWRQLGLETPIVAINVSTMQLWQSDFVETLQASMRRHGVPVSGICLELTESALVQHEHAQQLGVLDRLAELGVCLSIDDFGTGYSSLSYLHGLPVRQVKIDRSFLARAIGNDKRAQLFAGIVSLGHNLGLTVVAEGVENDAELALTQRYGCDLVQGFHLDRPMAGDDVAARFGRVHAHWTDRVLQVT